MRILLARPRGFCAGVERAIRIVELALERFGAPVYVRHEIVHNAHVVASLEARGVVFVDDPSEAPDGACLVLSAHGVAPRVRGEAERRGQHVLDATCPLVAKVHMEARRFDEAGHEILLVGHAGHVEVEGTMGEAPDRVRLVENVEDAHRVEVDDPERVAVLTQTTLSVDDTRDVIDALRERFPRLRAPRAADICYATQNRQDAVKALSARAELVLVVGSATSSNGMRLVETARRAGAQVHRVDDAFEIDPAWLVGVSCVGVTSGAAVPESLFGRVVDRLVGLAGEGTPVETMDGVEETMTFGLPAGLERASA